MLDLNVQIKEAIKSEYGTVAAFSNETGVPYSTLNSIIKNGPDNSKFDMIMKICRCLKIDVFNISDLNLSVDDVEFVYKLSRLDKHGAELLTAVLEREYKRSNKF